MAVNDAYATAAEYRAAIDKSDATEDLELLADLTAISRWLDRTLNRHFTKDAAPVARVFVPYCPTVVDVDDLVSVTSIKVDEDADGDFADETAWDASEYELLPRNAALGSEARPYWQIAATPWGARRFSNRVEVTGVWGWPAVPEAIKRATIHLTAILRLETPRATATVNDLGQLIQMTPQARRIVDDLAHKYRRLVVA